jgi:two-component system chemotaxis sensor kinase CheA
VLAKAIEKGLVAPDAQLTKEEIDLLIFAPGFSTAPVVSNISGRGVGMDVVRART